MQTIRICSEVAGRQMEGVSIWSYVQKAGWWLGAHVAVLCLRGYSAVGAAFLVGTPHLPESSLALFIKASRCTCSPHTPGISRVTEKGKLKGSCNIKPTENKVSGW